MRILHYSLGFPPARSGGLVEYSLSLINRQLQSGEDVFLLFPGNVDVLRKGTRIKFNNKHSTDKFKVYELVNSLPLPLYGGIKTPSDFKKKVDPKIYELFFDKISPDVIHVHTLMGLHLEFFEVAKKKNIKIVFTSHDYFGIAPEPNFFYQGRNYLDDNTDQTWANIAKNALSTRKLRLFQNSAYPLIKKVLKKLRVGKSKLGKGSSRAIKNRVTDSESNISVDNDFHSLREYYIKIFDLIDFVHFNSTVAQEIYSTFFLKFNVNLQSEVISISNENIVNREFSPKSISNNLRVGYIGPNEDYKGFYDFCKVASRLKNRNIEFHTYGYNSKEKIENIIEHGRYSSSELEKIYSNIDLLIVPSKWYETFGLVALEALSFHTVVFASSKTGAKDLLPSNCVFEDIQQLKVKVKQFDKKQTLTLNYSVKTMDKHAKEIKKVYLMLLK